MPFALSLTYTDASRAMETNTRVSANPDIMSTNPSCEKWKSIIGIPTPIRNASIRAMDSPAKMLNHNPERLIGWETISSINSEALYTYIVENIILIRGTIISTMVIRLNNPLVGLFSRLNTEKDINKRKNA